MREPDPVGVTVSLHLEHEIANVTETEAAVPPRVRQQHIPLSKMRVPSLPGTVTVHGSSPALAVDVVLERVEVVLELQVEDRRDVITPSQEVDGVSAWDLIDIRHDQKIVLLNAGDSKKLVQGHTLKGLFDEWILSFSKPSSYVPVRQPRLHEGELVLVVFEHERFRQTGEGGVGLEEDELSHVRVELFPADGQEVFLVAEEDGVVDAARGVSDSPAVEAAERGDGGVLGVVVGDGVERFWWGFPEGSEEVGELLAVEVDGEDGEGDEDEEAEECSDVEASEDAFEA